VQTLEGHENNVTAICAHPELPIIITASEDSTVKIWDAVTHRYFIIHLTSPFYPSAHTFFSFLLFWYEPYMSKIYNYICLYYLNYNAKLFSFVFQILIIFSLQTMLEVPYQLEKIIS